MTLENTQEIKIIDNFFEQTTFDNLVTTISSNNFTWFYLPCIGDLEDRSDVGFVHTIYNGYCPTSPFADCIMEPLVAAVKPKAIIRCRIGCYLKGEKIIHHAWHTDETFSHNAFMLYLNTNDGYTSFKDGTKINCVANRAVFFDPYVLHRSSNCTDQERRLTLTMNYF
jgi:hypothetical protein